MKKSFPTLLATMIWTALYSQHALADLAEQCMLGVPTYDKPLVSGDPNSLPVTINSDDSRADQGNAVFSGDVKIEQGNSTLTAKQVELNQVQASGQKDPVRTVTATGDVHYDDNQIKLKGPKAWSNLNTKDTDVYQGDYQMVGRQGRGDADKMKMRGQNRYTILENGSFTSCLPGDNSWSVVGSEVIHDREEQVAEIWNARFKIAGVPVFYSPYLQLPVGDKRRSGFLIPNAKYGSNNGFEFMLPYYWNIAPNFDATITPHYMTKRGLQWQNEFRYLTQPGMGTIEFDWLPSDNEYNKDHPQDDDTRWLFYWNHSGVMDQVWRFNVDYTKVSDSQYFNDLDSQYGSTTDGYATQKFSAGYADENFDATIASKQFQIYDDVNRTSTESYKVLPQIDLNYYKNDLGPFDLRVYGQAAKFININPYSPDATRLHLEPTLTLPMTNGWGSLNSEVKLLATHYQQDIPDGFKTNYKNRTGRDAPELDDSVNRVMPQFKVDGKMVFDRDMNWAQGYTQTLEPRMQYLYVPYRDQSNIYSYDSTLLQTDYSGLFRDRSYSGLDRIASQNRLATGLTSRIYDDALVERFNVSVGQIYYFSRSRTGDNNSGYDKNDDTGSVVWAGDTYWKIDDRWGLRGGVQYDTRLDSVALGDAVLEYRQDSERMVQLNYRYASPEYIQATLPQVTSPGYQDGISQVGVTASWPIADRWAVVGAYYYDTRAQQSADQLVGLRYNTCCWAVNIGYERKITDWDRGNQTSKYDNKVSFNIELRGLSSDHSLGTGEMLRSGILPYQRAF
ncbi:TPA: LPS assembly protein LptD [Serratia rubidaea]|uniref:LPS assembly protein LptD n=1 Tax=Serratia rubidaea TaxID=61652 RepID=UPI0023AFEDE5|nr:LPS assembly protein LptD [Serratia rubidaea]MDK1704787.1 LPS assembly protein LptD [Serratia rubidaea]HDJ1437919.1 LPS assembly protein LptD [Serratia rubidaea]HDJ1446793.1 LPS assembly protein LptD [Serratia rubidaea]HDJ1459506.1 LPS assembly protein LptD [Serratia rubidaea]HDJ2770379.1 LPS assembly protein LptD [Serratia rubidaea]